MNDSVIASKPDPHTPGYVDTQSIKTSYFLSLLWVCAIFIIIAVIANITELILIDFVHGNPHRSKSNALMMMWLFSIIFGITAIIGCFLVFGIPQIAQALLHSRVRRLSRPLSYLSILASIPAIAVLTWYCWEYLTPTDFNLGINEGPDWHPYRHGITVQRYLSAVAFQLPISLYALVYCEPDLIGSSRRSVVIFGLASAVLIGVWYGHRIGVGQYGFLRG